MTYKDRTKIIIDSFIKNKGHYRAMSKELTEKYGSGYSIGTISNYMNSDYIYLCATKEELDIIKKILIANSNNLGSNLDRTDNSYYQDSRVENTSKIIKLYLSGKTMQQIADELQISKATVSRIIKRYLDENQYSEAHIQIENMRNNNKQHNSENYKRASK